MEKIKTSDHMRNRLKNIWICLASSYAGVLAIWSLVYMGSLFDQNWLNIIVDFFWTGFVVFVVIFIFLPFRYPQFFTVFAWGVSAVFLFFFTLNLIKLYFLIQTDPYYLQNNEQIWGPGFHFMQFVLIVVTGLVVGTLWKNTKLYLSATRMC